MRPASMTSIAGTATCPPASAAAAIVASASSAAMYVLHDGRLLGVLQRADPGDELAAQQ